MIYHCDLKIDNWNKNIISQSFKVSFLSKSSLVTYSTVYNQNLFETWILPFFYDGDNDESFRLHLWILRSQLYLTAQAGGWVVGPMVMGGWQVVVGLEGHDWSWTRLEVKDVE